MGLNHNDCLRKNIVAWLHHYRPIRGKRDAQAHTYNTFLRNGMGKTKLKMMESMNYSQLVGKKSIFLETDGGTQWPTPLASLLSHPNHSTRQTLDKQEIAFITPPQQGGYEGKQTELGADHQQGRRDGGWETEQIFRSTEISRGFWPISTNLMRQTYFSFSQVEVAPSSLHCAGDTDGPLRLGGVGLGVGWYSSRFLRVPAGWNCSPNSADSSDFS